RMLRTVVVRFVYIVDAAKLSPASECIGEEVKPGLQREIRLRRVAAEVRVHERDEITGRRRRADASRNPRAVRHEAPSEGCWRAGSGTGSRGGGQPWIGGRRIENESAGRGRCEGGASERP